MEREEIGLLAVCYFSQWLAEGTPYEIPIGWIEVGAVAKAVNIPAEVAARIFERWQERGWLDEKYAQPHRCGLSAGGQHAAQAILCWHPKYGKRPIIGR